MSLNFCEKLCPGNRKKREEHKPQNELLLAEDVPAELARILQQAIPIVVISDGTREIAMEVVTGNTNQEGSLPPEMIMAMIRQLMMENREIPVPKIDYQPLNQKEKIPIKILTETVGKDGPKGLMWRLGTNLHHIHLKREHNKNYCPTDEEAEYFRSAMFLMKAAGFPEEDFCPEGREKISQIKAIIHDYETRKGGPSWETGLSQYTASEQQISNQ